MNKFSELANAAKAEHQRLLDTKAAEVAQQQKAYADAREGETKILLTEIMPILEEARAGLRQSGLPAEVKAELDKVTPPTLILIIERQVDVRSRPFPVSAKLTVTIDAEKKRIRMGRTSWSSGPAAYAYSPIGQSEEMLSEQIGLVLKDWFRINEGFAGR